MLCIIIIHSYTWHVHSALILEEIHHGHLFTHCINFNFRFHEEFHYLCCHISLISPGTNNKGLLAIRNDETDMLKGNLLFLWGKKYMKYEAV